MIPKSFPMGSRSLDKWTDDIVARSENVRQLAREALDCDKQLKEQIERTETQKVKLAGYLDLNAAVIEEIEKRSPWPEAAPLLTQARSAYAYFAETAEEYEHNTQTLAGFESASSRNFRRINLVLGILEEERAVFHRMAALAASTKFGPKQLSWALFIVLTVIPLPSMHSNLWINGCLCVAIKQVLFWAGVFAIENAWLSYLCRLAQTETSALVPPRLEKGGAIEALFTAKTIAAVFQPVIDDEEQSWLNAMDEDRILFAEWIRVRCGLLLAKTAVVRVLDPLLQVIQRIKDTFRPW